MRYCLPAATTCRARSSSCRCHHHLRALRLQDCALPACHAHLTFFLMTPGAHCTHLRSALPPPPAPITSPHATGRTHCHTPPACLYHRCALCRLPPLLSPPTATILSPPAATPYLRACASSHATPATALSAYHETPRWTWRAWRALHAAHLASPQCAHSAARSASHHTSLFSAYRRAASLTHLRARIPLFSAAHHTAHHCTHLTRMVGTDCTHRSPAAMFSTALCLPACSRLTARKTPRPHIFSPASIDEISHYHLPIPGCIRPAIWTCHS